MLRRDDGMVASLLRNQACDGLRICTPMIAFRQLILGDLSGVRAAVMPGRYLLRTLTPPGTARLLKSSIHKASSARFILELPQMILRK